jgi:hypothetical protein
MSTKNRDFDALKTKLTYRLAYILFVDLFNPTIFEGKLDTYIDNIKFTYELIESLCEDNYDKVYPVIITPMEAQIKEYQTFCLPKKPIEDIGQYYIENESLFLNEGKFKGAIEYKIIKPFFDTKNFLPLGLPDHALIGIKDNAGSLFIEESLVLNDAFYFLAHTEKLIEDYKKIPKEISIDKTDSKTRNLRKSISSNSRSAIQFFNNFIESFVGSIGYDYYSSNKNSLSKEEKSILLKGKKPRKQFLPLKRRIIELLNIICSEESLKLVWNKDNPVEEPYKSFFKYMRYLRTLLVHPEPSNGIFQTPADWYQDAYACGKISMEVSKDLWKRCYPNKEFPEYLGFLDFDKNLKKGSKVIYE